MTTPQQWYVNYSVVGLDVLDGDYQVGPYPDRDTAESHHRDIKSYAGVSQCYITDVEDANRNRISA